MARRVILDAPDDKVGKRLGCTHIHFAEVAGDGRGDLRGVFIRRDLQATRPGPIVAAGRVAGETV
jgi:hypothetical protein